MENNALREKECSGRGIDIFFPIVSLYDPNRAVELLLCIHDKVTKGRKNIRLLVQGKRP